MKPSVLGALLLACALPLGACSTISADWSKVKTAVAVVNGITITQSDLNALVTAYDTTVLRPVNLYRYSNYTDAAPIPQLVARPYCTKSAPFSTTNVCASYSVLSKLIPVLGAVDKAEATLQADVTGCNVSGDQSACTGLSAAKATFQAAVSVATTTATQLGVI